MASRRSPTVIANSEIVVRLLVAALIGSLVGFERERLLWSAGIRTHMLVCVGACLIMIVSAYGFESVTRTPHVVLDPSRIAAQVVSGIGFLGAGAIVMRGATVRGMTTAASIWAVAALGLAAGGGLYFAAVVTTIIVLVILAGLKPLEEAYRARIQSYVVHIRLEPRSMSLEEVRKALGVRGGQIRRVETTIGADGLEDQTIHLVRVSRADIREGSERLKATPGVQSVETSRETNSASFD